MLDKRRKGGRTVCGCGWGWVCLGVCAGFAVWGVEGVRTALHLSQGRAGSIILSGAVLLRERGAGAFKGWLWLWVKGSVRVDERAGKRCGRVCRSFGAFGGCGVVVCCVWRNGEWACGNGLRGRRLGRATRGVGWRACVVVGVCGGLNVFALWCGLCWRVNRKCALRWKRAERAGCDKAERWANGLLVWLKCGFVWVCVRALWCGEWKEFARLCICRKGERGGALCKELVKAFALWFGYIE